MSSKTHRRKVRAQRRRKRANTGSAVDPHSDVIMQSLAGMLDTISHFARSDDPVADLGTALAELVDELTARFRSVDPARAIEVTRLACLPWSFGEHVPAGSQRGPTQAELIALISITAAHSALGREDANGDAPSQDEPLGDADNGDAHPEPGPNCDCDGSSSTHIDREEAASKTIEGASVTSAASAGGTTTPDWYN